MGHFLCDRLGACLCVPQVERQVTHLCGDRLPTLGEPCEQLLDVIDIDIGSHVERIDLAPQAFKLCQVVVQRGNRVDQRGVRLVPVCHSAAPRIRSTSFKSAGVSFHVAASLFARTCAGVFAPAMTLTTWEREASQEKANCKIERPRDAANPTSASTRSRFSGVKTLGPNSSLPRLDSGNG